MKIENAFAPRANAVAIRVRGAENARRVCGKNISEEGSLGGLIGCVAVGGGFFDTVWAVGKVPSSLSIGASAGWFSARTIEVQ